MPTELFSTTEFIARILISVLCGAAIGFERSRRQKEAGIRTHTIVALGSALMMIISKYGFFDVVVLEGISLDASRIAANIITGISFVGAGMIFVRGYSITGLTTASGIWATSGVGMALGAGMYTVGLFSTALIILIQMLMHGALKRLDQFSTQELTIVLSSRKGALERLQQQFDAKGISFSNGRIERGEDKTITVQLSLQHVKSGSIDRFLAQLSDNEDILSIAR